MLVLKFGGSSLAGAVRMRQSARIVARHHAHSRVVVVVSAMAGITDALFEVARLAQSGAGWSGALARIVHRHRAVARALTGEVPGTVDAALRALEHDARRLAVTALADTNAWPMTAARFSGWGELLAVDLFAHALEVEGVPAHALPRAPVLLEHLAEDSPVPVARARPSVLATRGWLVPRLAGAMLGGGVPVLPGYIALDAAGAMATLGRNGSDTSAAIVSVALGAQALYLYSDVAGIYSADPRVVPEATLLPRVSYAAAAEAAQLGARVLHPQATAPLARWGIPLHLRSSLDPDAPGTDVVPDAAISDESGTESADWIVAARDASGAGVLDARDGQPLREISLLPLGTRLPAEAALAMVAARLLAHPFQPYALRLASPCLHVVVTGDQAALAQRLIHSAVAEVASDWHTRGVSPAPARQISETLSAKLA
jgi:aspartate kinase